MRQIRFYFPQPLKIHQHYAMPADVARHMSRVLRLQANDHVILFNGDGSEYIAKLTEVSKKNVSVLVENKVIVDRESPLKVHLIQALSKGDKMETTIQKVVELGITRITPVKSERSNVNLSGARLEKKMHYWRGVVNSACEQTGRNNLPELHQLCLLDSLLDAQRNHMGLKLIFSPDATVGLSEIVKLPQDVTYLIGPEGGLSEAETKLAIECGFIEIRVGPRVLRTETAGPAVLSMIQVLWGDMK